MALKTVTIKQRILIPSVKPEEVYSALADPKKHSAFTASKATMNPKPGGRFTAWDDYITGKNLELIKGKKIVQEWKTSVLMKSSVIVAYFTMPSEPSSMS